MALVRALCYASLIRPFPLLAAPLNTRRQRGGGGERAGERHSCNSSYRFFVPLLFLSPLLQFAFFPQRRHTLQITRCGLDAIRELCGLTSSTF